MTAQEFWADVNKEKAKLYADQATRQSLVSRGEPDPSPWQPLSEPFAWSVTLPVRGGVQKGGAIVPLSFEILARNIVGPNGHALNRLATEAEMIEFHADEAGRRIAIQRDKDREQNRTSINVQPVSPAARGERA
jgi:hypothetical protein